MAFKKIGKGESLGIVSIETPTTTKSIEASDVDTKPTKQVGTGK